jgi:RNA polymerase sigma factor (sigma-70 family)
MGMLYEQLGVQEVVRRIAERMAFSGVCGEDLFQEGWVYLWLQETRRPGQTQSWYLQGCRFYLTDLIGAGRSLDSPKRGSGLRLREEHREEELPFPESLQTMAELEEFYVRDARAALAAKLTESENLVLDLLLQGWSTCEIARQTGVSHSTVARHRRRIAAAALRLGIRHQRQRV